MKKMTMETPQKWFFDRNWDKNLIDLKEIIQIKQEYNDAVSGIYFLFKGDNLLYIGSSKNCFQRFSQHKIKGKVFDSYFIIDTNELNDEERFEIEAKYIFKYLPPLNKDSFIESRKRLGWIRSELKGTNISDNGRS